MTCPSTACPNWSGVAVALLTVATPAAAFECPERGGRTWREVRAAHVILVTDLRSGKAQDLAQELEQISATLDYALPKGPRPSKPVRVVALNEEEDFDLFAPARVAAYFLPGSFGAPPTIVMPAFPTTQRQLIAHELTHYLMARAFVRQPVWFSEGMAAFMESLEGSRGFSIPTLGGVRPQYYRLVRPYRGGMEGVLRAREKLKTPRDYAMAWALVHFLFNQEPERFARLQGAFARGMDPDEAWREVFPEWDPRTLDGPKALDQAVGRHLDGGRYRYAEVKLPKEQEVTERILPAREVHAVRLSLPWYNRGKALPTALLKEEVEEALAHDPGHVAALRQSAGPALARAEKAVAAHPEDPEAWIFLGNARPQGTSPREEAYRKAVEVDPENPWALSSLANELLQAGRSGEALPMTRKAIALAPSDPVVIDGASRVAEDLGQCAEARALQLRAIDVLPDRWPMVLRDPFFQALVRLDGKCGPGAR